MKIEKRKPRVMRNCRRGLATVEMVLLLPILIALSFAAMEYGWMFYKQQQITNAARQGARLGAMPNATSAQVTARVDAILTECGFDKGKVPYTIELTPNSIAYPGVTPGNTIKVKVTVPYGAKPGIALTRYAFGYDGYKIPVPVPDALSYTCTMGKEGP
jgi:Flp pilus assembly protein TadG